MKQFGHGWYFTYTDNFCVYRIEVGFTRQANEISVVPRFSYSQRIHYRKSFCYTRYFLRPSTDELYVERPCDVKPPSLSCGLKFDRLIANCVEFSVPELHDNVRNTRGYVGRCLAPRGSKSLHDVSNAVNRHVPSAASSDDVFACRGPVAYRR